jgi:hypothetical protein
VIIAQLSPCLAADQWRPARAQFVAQWRGGVGGEGRHRRFLVEPAKMINTQVPSLINTNGTLTIAS